MSDNPLAQIGLVFCGFQAAVLFNHLGAAYPAFRGGVLLLNICAIAFCAFLGFYRWWIAKQAKAPSQYLVSATLPSALALLLLIIAGVLGVWTA